MNWGARRALVTGGCSFIGSHLVERLLNLGTRVRVVDNLSTGRPANLAAVSADVELVEGDLLAPGTAETAMAGVDLVFHLAATHGERDFMDLHQARCARNLVLDGLVVDAAVRAGVQNFVFASSACVYPVDLRARASRPVRLTESKAGPPYHADGMYGWAKLMTEMTLAALATERGFPSVSCRLFAVYGERCPDAHPLAELVRQARVAQQPFEIRGDGSQVRSWTYVEDIVRGLTSAAERIRDGSAVNLGTEESVRVIDAARAVLELTGHQAPIRTRPDRPTGPRNRVASAEKAFRLLDWAPQMPFRVGLQRLIDWYDTRPARTGTRRDRQLVDR